jgi:hypothetical protein
VIFNVSRPKQLEGQSAVDPFGVARVESAILLPDRYQIVLSLSPASVGGGFVAGGTSRELLSVGRRILQSTGGGLVPVGDTYVQTIDFPPIHAARSRLVVRDWRLLYPDPVELIGIRSACNGGS